METDDKTLIQKITNLILGKETPKEEVELKEEVKETEEVKTTVELTKNETLQEPEKETVLFSDEQTQAIKDIVKGVITELAAEVKEAEVEDKTETTEMAAVEEKKPIVHKETETITPREIQPNRLKTVRDRVWEAMQN